MGRSRAGRRSSEHLALRLRGPAWTLGADTSQYYYHAFSKEQPDLNWRNKEVREAMLGVMKIWLERGADGFR
jgi:alpha-glucosidase